MFGLTPWKEKGVAFPTLRDEFKTLYDRFFGGWPMAFEGFPERERFWNLDMNETEKEFFVRAEIPGFEAADINVEVSDGRLMIKAEKKVETGKKEKGNGFEYAERHYERYVELPTDVDAAKVEAAYKNGVLELHLPKTAKAKGVRIPIK